MPSSASRRRFLRVGVVGSLAAVGGCLDSIRTGVSRPQDRQAEITTEPGTPTVRTLEPPDGPRTDDLYVKNDDGDVERVSLRLVRVDGEADETVLDNDYRFPRATQMVIPDVGERGATYEISVAVEGEQAGTWTWDVRTCEGSEAPKGNRDAEVWIEDGETEVVKNACDAIAVRSRNAVDHAEFLVEDAGTGAKTGTETKTGTATMTEAGTTTDG